MIYDHILLKGGVGPPDYLLDGELYIDETTGVLYVNTALDGIEALPLDAMPVAPVTGDVSKYLIKRGLVTDYDVISAGGGGRTFDAQPWRVPGLCPTGVSVESFAAGSVTYTLFELAEPKTLQSLRVNPITNLSLDFGIVEWNSGEPGKVLLKDTTTAAGATVTSETLVLEPGCYASFFAPFATVSAQVITGFQRGGRIHGDAMAGYVASSATVGAVGSSAPNWDALTAPYDHPVTMSFA